METQMPLLLPEVIQEQEQVLLWRQGRWSPTACTSLLDAIPDPLTDHANAASVQPEDLLKLPRVLQHMVPLVLKEQAVPLQVLHISGVFQLAGDRVQFLVRPAWFIIGGASNVVQAVRP